MSAEAQIEELARPLSVDRPCGEDLEDTQLLASFDTFRLFGQMVPLPPDTDWRAIKVQALEGMRRSKDLRLLGHYAAAALRVDGWAGFFAGLHTAAGWVKNYWPDVYPRVDEDAILRKNALNTLSDRMSVLDGLRRMPILEHRQLGRISLRDVDIAAGQLAATEADVTPATESQVAAVFAAAALADMQMLKSRITHGISDLTAIDTAMRDFGGAGASPDFEPLLILLARVDRLLGDQLVVRGVAQGDESATEQGQSETGGAGGIGGIKSRLDALRALDAIALFFRQTEPSSPVPLFLERAKNLIGKDFLEILADVAPESVALARNAGGLKD